MLQALDSLEYTPFLSQQTKFFKKSDFSIYKIGVDIFRMPQFQQLATKLFDEPQDSLQRHQLFAFFLRDNCYIEKFDLDIHEQLTRFYILPLRLRTDVKVVYTNAAKTKQTTKQTLDLKLDQSIQLSSKGSLQFTWQDQGDYSAHSVFAIGWMPEK